MSDRNAMAVFLDRDGTLIREVGYLSDPDDIEVFPEAFEAVRRINDSGARAVVITNQSGLARGLLSEDDLARIHARLGELFEAEKAPLVAFFHCPHHPEGVRQDLRRRCECRKPAPGLLLRAAHQLELDLRRSVMVGDKLIDVEAAHRAGSRGVLVRSGYGEQSELRLGALGPEEDVKQPDFVADGVLEAVCWALEEKS